MLRYSRQALFNVGIVVSSFWLVSGCDSSTTPPSPTLTASRWNDAVVVTGTGDPSVDVPAVQAAVDQGGDVILEGHFSFDKPPTQPLAATLGTLYAPAAEVLISHAVRISGSRENEGSMATIDGGTIPFYVAAPGQSVSIERLRFVRPTTAAIFVFAVTGLEVTSTKIESGVPFNGLASGIYVVTSANLPLPSNPGHPENVSGLLRFVSNDVDMAGGTAVANTLGITVFAVGVPGAEANVEVLNNTITNTTEPAINFRRVVGIAKIEHNTIVTDTIVGNAPRNQAIRVANTGSYLIAHNSIDCRWVNAEAEAIGVFSQVEAWPIQNAIVVNNAIDMTAPSGTVFTTFSAGIAVYGFANGNLVRHNSIRGQARAGVAIPVFPLTGTPAAPHDNAFVENRFVQFTPSLADYFVGAHAVNTRIVGRGTVEDEGTETIIVPSEEQ